MGSLFVCHISRYIALHDRCLILGDSATRLVLVRRACLHLRCSACPFLSEQRPKLNIITVNSLVNPT